MILGTSNRHTYQSRLLRMVLLVALVFAAWHVASHDIDTSGDIGSHEECQLCRLNHVSITDLPILTWIVPLLIVSLVLIVPVLQRATQSYRYTLGARAPPLF